MSFTKRRTGATKKGATFKDSHKKTIKFIYVSLILIFYLYFYTLDSQKIVGATEHTVTVKLLL